MRSIVPKFALALILMAGAGAAVAKAQVVRIGPTGTSYVYPYVTTSAYTPTYFNASPYTYTPPYLWSAERYITPARRGIFYQRYYPYTNQYYYTYRILPGPLAYRWW
ncbi:MAG TPA: hypothetical protein VGJ05_21215 [Fimbriiglobus sp.]|jgi:hypothetical protein